MICRLSERESDVSILAWIVVGLVAGLLAKLLMPGRDPGGIILTILLGIGGAIVGGSWRSRSGLATALTISISAQLCSPLSAP